MLLDEITLGFTRLAPRLASKKFDFYEDKFEVVV